MGAGGASAGDRNQDLTDWHLVEGLTTAVAQPRTRYMQIASRNQFGSLR